MLPERESITSVLPLNELGDAALDCQLKTRAIATWAWLALSGGILIYPEKSRQQRLLQSATKWKGAMNWRKGEEGYSKSC